MYTPSRSDLLHRGFNPRPEGVYIKWIKAIKPVTGHTKNIIYREQGQSWGFGGLRFSIRSEEDLDSLIKLLSKGK